MMSALQKKLDDKIWKGVFIRAGLMASPEAVGLATVGMWG